MNTNYTNTTVAPAAPVVAEGLTELRRSVENTIIGLRDGWATRADADAVLAALAAYPVAGSPAEAELAKTIEERDDWKKLAKEQIAKVAELTGTMGSMAIQKLGGEPVPASEAANADTPRMQQLLMRLNVCAGHVEIERVKSEIIRYVNSLLAAPAAPTDAKPDEARLTIREAFEQVGGFWTGGDNGYPTFGSAEALRMFTLKMQRNMAIVAAAQSVRDAAPAAPAFKDRRRFEERG